MSVTFIFCFPFSNFNDELLRCFRALDYRFIPQDRAQLLRYGTLEIKQLLIHMEAVFPKDTNLQIDSFWIVKCSSVLERSITNWQCSKYNLQIPVEKRQASPMLGSSLNLCDQSLHSRMWKRFLPLEPNKNWTQEQYFRWQSQNVDGYHTP